MSITSCVVPNGTTSMIGAPIGSLSSENNSELDLVTALIEGAFESPPWSTFLKRLQLATGADYAALNIRSPNRRFADSLMLYSGEAKAEIYDRIPSDFPPGEPPVDDFLVEGKPYSMNELFAGRSSSQFLLLRDFLLQKGITSVRQMRVQEPSGVHAWVTISRGGDQNFTPAHNALLSSLVRVLRGVLRQYVALERERFGASLIADPVRRLRFGWLTLDRLGHVLDYDDQGATVLTHSRVLGRTSNGRLTAHSAQLEDEIFDALQHVIDDPHSRSYAIPLSRDPWLDMLLIPAPAHCKWMSAKTAPAAIAYVHGDSWRSPDRCEQLAQLFRLSPQESKLALALCRGKPLAEAALECGIAVGTARNYSKTLYAKTGARGQSDLVRIVMRSVLAVAPNA
jgi:DNA-binding CsgD family transcriptional regulator